jgi:hypothetical protein
VSVFSRFHGANIVGRSIIFRWESRLGNRVPKVPPGIISSSEESELGRWKCHGALLGGIRVGRDVGVIGKAQVPGSESESLEEPRIRGRLTRVVGIGARTAGVGRRLALGTIRRIAFSNSESEVEGLGEVVLGE